MLKGSYLCNLRCNWFSSLVDSCISISHLPVDREKFMALLRRSHRWSSLLQRCSPGVRAIVCHEGFGVHSKSSTSNVTMLQMRQYLSWMRPARLCPAQVESEFTIAVDRSGLKEHEHHEAAIEKNDETPLARHIKGLIRFRGGPITVAEYMAEVLTNPRAGYYMHRDVFGADGDFVTSPDISQMFGEMVGVWTTSLWQQMGEPEEVNLVELGPGRGTLMADLLRGTSKFPAFSKALSVHLVECSPALRKRQYEALNCKAGELQEASPNAAPSGSPITRSVAALPVSAVSQLTGTPVSWHLDLEQVPKGCPTIIIAHEFLDALPIHQFQKTERGWREKLVDISEDGLRFVLSPDVTPASRLYLAPRLKFASKEELEQFPQVEVCPQALKLTRDISRRIGKDGGGALIIDYGKNQLVSDSLQAIRKHQFVNVFEEPGTADLSAFVDFAALKQMVEDTKAGATAFGPITQSQVLGMLGINFRLEALLKNATDEQAEALQLGYWRLVGDGEPPWLEEESPDSLQKLSGMGSKYLALAIVNNNLGAPAGFQ